MNRADDSTEQAATSQEPLPAFSAAPAFHSDDVEHVASYQSLSVLAIISLLIGLASPLCILSRGFLLLPLCGLALSLLALRRIAMSENRLAGRWAAVIGLTLCVAFGAASISRDSMFRYLRTSQAEDFASQWLALVTANELEQAFKLTYDGARPPEPPEPGRPAPEKPPYETFLSDPLIQRIVAAGKNATIQYVDTLQFAPQTRQDVFVRQQFSVTPGEAASAAGATDPVEAYVTVQRSRFPGASNRHWLVTRYQPTDAPAE